ncbi:MAG: protein YgfX [Burkholderiales bacterium]
MSIAVSVVVKPSRLLFILVAGICLGAALVGVSVGLGVVGELPVWERTLYAGFCIFLALAGLVRTARRRKTFHVDISGTGQIRLRAEGQSLSFARMQEPNDDGLLVKLLADSTIWPRFLLLRLRAEDGRIHIVPILHDCLPEEPFRAISVACRWIAAHNFVQ